MCEEESKQVKVGDKNESSYISASLWALDNYDEAIILGRGTNIKKCIDVAEIVKRKLDNPKCDVEIGTEESQDRKVSSIEIIISDY